MTQLAQTTRRPLVIEPRAATVFSEQVNPLASIEIRRMATEPARSNTEPERKPEVTESSNPEPAH